MAPPALRCVSRASQQDFEASRSCASSRDSPNPVHTQDARLKRVWPKHHPHASIQSDQATPAPESHRDDISLCPATNCHLRPLIRPLSPSQHHATTLGPPGGPRLSPTVTDAASNLESSTTLTFLLL